MTEVWKPVLGFESLYMVSNWGRIKRLPRHANRFGRCIILPERLLNPSICKRSGYHNFSAIDLNGNKKQLVVHRLVAEAFCVGKDSQRNHVNHINAIRTDNRADNLEWCTPHENALHALKMGRYKFSYGEDQVNSILTEKQVLEIRDRYIKASNGPDNGISLAAEFGVSNVTIHNIVNKKSWNHI